MKKWAAILLSLVVAAGMSASVFAADPAPYGPQVEDLGYAYDEDEVKEQVVDLGKIYPSENTTREIPLVYGLFDVDPPEGKGLEDNLTSEELELVDAKISAAAGSEIISAVVDKTNGVIRLSFAKDFDGDADVPFDVTAYLIVDGEKYDDLGLTFIGTVVANEDAEPADGATQPAAPNPDTGDTSFLGIAIAAMAVSAVVAGLVLLRRKR